MSKFEPLWEHIHKRGESPCKMTFDEVRAVLGISIDHSFLKYKKELEAYGYAVGKISLKEQTVIFERLP